jgi:hypothetical protein
VGSRFRIPRCLTHVAFVTALLVGALAGTAASGSQAAVPGIPSIYVSYDADCSFDMSIDGGYTLLPASGPGPTLPPGTYQLELEMPYPTDGYSCELPTFSLAGPGLLSVTPYNGDWLLDDDVLTLQPSATYVAEDQNAPRATARIFTTSAGGSSTSLLPPPGPARPSRSSTQAALVGSAVPRYRGTLVATVDTAGRARLARSGRAVASLRAGVYELRIDDRARHAGFSLRRGGRKPVALTSRAFVGERARRITLTTGSWTFFATPGDATRLKVLA